MSNDTEIVAFRGEDIHLGFTAGEYFLGDITLVFSVYEVNDDGTTGPLKYSFEEPVTATKVEHETNKVSAVEWNVNLRQTDLNHGTYRVLVKAIGDSESGQQIVCSLSNSVLVTEIVITDDPALRLIMAHEFVIDGGNQINYDTGKSEPVFHFDDAPLRHLIRELTPQQKHLLATYPLNGREGRLVVFATFQPGIPHPRYMYADFDENWPTCVYANANLAVFACRPKKPPMLVSYTRNTLINTRNEHTTTLFQNNYENKPPAEWLRPTNSNPPRFSVGSFCTTGTDGVIWSRLFKPSREDAMPHNTIHGMINTRGCWMLFRNYNWPLPDKERERMLAIYLRCYLQDKKEDRTRRFLGTYRLDKFKFFDVNFAYNFFCRWVVGVKFFSSDAEYFASANMYKTHGFTREESIPPRDGYVPNEFLTTDEVNPGYLYYDVKYRSLAMSDGLSESIFIPGDDLWVKNRLGFQTAKGFLPEGGWKNPLTEQDVKDRTWSDWFFFKPDNISLTKALEVHMSPVPSLPPDPSKKYHDP